MRSLKRVLFLYLNTIRSLPNAYKEKHGVDFDAEKIFCWGCKTKDKPLGITISKCTVRNCAIKKGYDCCIECNNLVKCEFELWKNFPDFHKQVLEMQKTYMATK